VGKEKKVAGGDSLRPYPYRFKGCSKGLGAWNSNTKPATFPVRERGEKKRWEPGRGGIPGQDIPMGKKALGKKKKNGGTHKRVLQSGQKGSRNQTSAKSAQGDIIPSKK